MRHVITPILIALALALAGCAATPPEREESIGEIVTALQALHGEGVE